MLLLHTFLASFLDQGKQKRKTWTKQDHEGSVGGREDSQRGGWIIGGLQTIENKNERQRGRDEDMV